MSLYVYSIVYVHANTDLGEIGSGLTHVSTDPRETDQILYKSLSPPEGKHSVLIPLFNKEHSTIHLPTAYSF